MMAKHPTLEIHALTTAEIARKQAALAARHREIIDERADDYRKAVKTGAPTPNVDADERAAREHARSILNGAAPASLSLPPEISREKILLREQRGIEIALKILGDQNLATLAVEAVAWAEKHADQWRQLARETILTAVRLEALEQAAAKLMEGCPDIHAISLPMTHLIGSRYQNIPNAGFFAVTPNDLLQAGLDAGFVTNREIEKAKNV